MDNQNQSFDSLEDVKNIRQMMERSSRFISLSGLSGIAAGICALVGAGIARYVVFEKYYGAYDDRGSFSGAEYDQLKLHLFLLASAVFAAAFSISFYFTWRKSKKEGMPLWNHTSRRLAWNMILPLMAGGLFILGLLHHNDWRFVAPSFLVFYGLALVNASKYTFSDIRYLGYCEITLGLLNMLWIGYGLYFWAVGFGVLHIIYGAAMWWKYDRVKK